MFQVRMISLVNPKRQGVSHKNQHELQHISDEFYALLDANALLGSVCDDFVRKFVFAPGTTNTFSHMVAEVTHMWWNTHAGKTPAESVLFLRQQVKILTAFLKKHPEYAFKQMNYLDILSQECAYIQKEMSIHTTDDNWYHWREMLAQLESRKHRNAKETKRIIDAKCWSLKVYYLQTILDAFKWLERIAELFELK